MTSSSNLSQSPRLEGAPGADSSGGAAGSGGSAGPGGAGGPGGPAGRPRRRTTLPRSTRGWSRGIVWTLIGLTGFGVIWGSVAQVENSITTNGQLGPKGGTTSLSPPFNGLVAEILVKEGQLVEPGQPLVRLRNKVGQQGVNNLMRIRQQWQDELEVLRRQLGLPALNPLDPMAQYKMDVSYQELMLRLKGNERVQAKSRIEHQQQVSDARGLRQQLNINLDILKRQQKLYAQGAIANLEIDRQREQIARLSSALRRSELEVLNSNERMAEARLTGQQIATAERKQIFARYDNARQQFIQVSTSLLEQKDRLVLETLVAPIKGVVFDLTVRKGEIATPARPTLKLIAPGKLNAKISITPLDIGFVDVGMPVEIRVNSYPFTEYGSIMGKIVSISADAFPPDNSNPQERFKATVELATDVMVKDGEQLRLQPGMAISGLIKLGKQPVISIITDRFNAFFDSASKIR